MNQPAQPTQQPSTALATKTDQPIVAFQSSLKAMLPQFKVALPNPLLAEKFVRVVQTAVQLSTEKAATDLLAADRRSLFGACMRAAQDGLMPDGRQSALVVYNTNVAAKGERPRYERRVQYMPMVAGIMKKVRESGTIANWSVQVVKERDVFDYEQGDNEHITHKPTLGNRGKTIGAYSIVTMKSGEKSREVMSIEDIEKVRARSRTAEGGPWVSDFDEMARKTVIRRHSKRLDMDGDASNEKLLATIQADDSLTDLTPLALAAPAAETVVVAPERKRGRPTRLPAAETVAPQAEPEPPEPPQYDDEPPPLDDMP